MEVEPLRDAPGTIPVIPMDVDGDGKEEALVWRCGGNRGYALPGCDPVEQLSPSPLQILAYEKKTIGQGLSGTFTLQDTSINAWGYPKAADFIPVDVNGDGLRDLLQLVSPAGPALTWRAPATGHLRLLINTQGDFVQRDQPILSQSSAQPFLLDRERDFVAAHEFQRALVIDHDGDGRQDILMPRDGEQRRGIAWCPRRIEDYFLFRADAEQEGFHVTPAFSDPQTPSHYAAVDVQMWFQGWFGSRTLDIDGNGYSDVIFPFHRYFLRHRGHEAKARPDRLTGVRDGTIDFAPSPGDVPFSTKIEYTPMTPKRFSIDWRSPYVLDPSVSCTYPCAKVKGARYLVRATEQQNLSNPGSKSGAKLRTEYFYRDAMADRHGAGWLGFSSVLRKEQHSDDLSPVWQRFLFNPSRYVEPSQLSDSGVYPEVGRPYAVLSFGTDDCEEEGRLWLRYDAREWSIKQTADALAFHSYYIYERRGSTRTYECLTLSEESLGASITDPESALSSQTPYLLQTLDRQSVDHYGNTTSLVTSWQAIGVDPMPHQRVETTSYHNAPVDWIVSRPVTNQIEETRGAWTQRRRYGREYDHNGALIANTVSEPSDPQHYLRQTLDRDAFGNVIGVEVQDAQGVLQHQLRMTYDPDGIFVHAVTNALGHITRYQHDPDLGERTAVTDPNGRTTWWLYDEFGALRQVHHPDGRSTTFWTMRDQVGEEYLLSLHQKASTGERSIVTYDAQQRPVRVHEVGLRGRTTSVQAEYWGFGGLKRVSRPFEYGSAPGADHWMHYEYDLQRRPVRVGATDGVENLYSYQGTLRTHQNGRGHHTHQRWDGLGQVVQAVDAAGKVTDYTFGPFGALRRVEAFGDITTIDVDDYGWRTRLIDPDMGEQVTRFDALGQPRLVTDAEGQTTSSCYDPAGRILSRTDLDGTTRFVYDAAPGALGALTAVLGADGHEIHQRYDSAGRLYQSERRILSAQGQLESFEVELGYNGLGQLARVSYPEIPGAERFSVEHRYDSFGSLVSIEEPSGAALWSWDSQGPAGEVAGFTLGNQVHSQRTYNPQTGLLERIETSAPSGQLLQNLALGYDENGNVDRLTDALQGLTERYSYDALDRLHVTEISELSFRRDFGYAPNGNLIWKDDVGQLSYDPGHQPHAVREAAGFTYEYDNNGNQTVRPDAYGDPMSLSYTPFHKPRSMVGSFGTVRFEYDGLGERVQKTTPLETITYVDKLYKRTQPAMGNVEHELLVHAPTGPFLAVRFVEQPQPAPARIDHYIHGDHLGSPNVITDGAGQELERLSYDAFGQARDPDWTKTDPMPPRARWLGFTGHEDEGGLGIVNMGGRMYDPKLGRFLSPDPIVQAPLHSQSLNRFSYVWNNPLTNTDPTGYEMRPGEVFLGQIPAGAEVGDSIATLGGGIWTVTEVDEDGDVHVERFSLSDGPVAGVGTTGGRSPIAPQQENGNAPASSAPSNSAKPSGAPAAQSPNSAVRSAARVSTTTRVAMEVAQGAGEMLLGALFPPAGWILDARDLGQAISKGDAIGIGVAVIGFAPILGDFAKGALKSYRVAKVLRKAARGSCFVAGTPVHTLEGPRPIETIEPGDRVWTASGSCGPGLLGDWRLVELALEDPKDREHLIFLKVLRSAQWLKAEGIEGPGDQSYVELDELEVSGRARVVALRPAPRIASGCGRLVMGTLTHLNNDVRELSFEGVEEPLRVTGLHPLFSLDRKDWVLVRHLLLGERLQTIDGSAVIEAIRQVPEERRVFNLSVEGEREYLVGEEAIRAHNSCVTEPGGDFIRETALKKTAGKIGKRIKKSLRRETKAAEKALRTNDEFRDWFHRDFKPGQQMTGGGQHNRDMSPEMVLEAWKEFNRK